MRLVKVDTEDSESREVLLFPLLPLWAVKYAVRDKFHDVPNKVNKSNIGVPEISSLAPCRSNSLNRFSCLQYLPSPPRP